MNKKKLIRMVSVYSVIYTTITLLNISNKLLMYESEIHPLHKLRLCNGYRPYLAMIKEEQRQQC